MNYKDIADELRAQAAKISASIPAGEAPTLDHKFYARRAVSKAVGDAGYPRIANNAAAKIVPLFQPLNFADVVDTAAAIEKGKDGLFDQFGDLMMQEVVDY
jgi:hypothetical protein